MDIKNWILNNLYFKNGSLSNKVYNDNWWIKKQWQNQKETILSMTKFLDGNATWSERIYCILNDLHSKTLCINCKTNFVSYDATKKYLTYCSTICSNSDQEKKKTNELSNIKKHGVSYPQQTKTVKEKQKKTNILRYGHSCPLLNKSIREKSKKTMLKRYGNINFNVSQMQKTLLKKYNVKSPSQLKDFDLKTKNTKLQKHGDENFNNRKKAIKTNQKKYKVDHPMQNTDIARKSMSALSKNKLVKTPSGKILKLKGYEPSAYKLLLESYNEIEILTNDNVPIIEYVFNGKKHKYYPDFYIPKENLIIEVKSPYTYNKTLHRNLIKKEFTIKSGYNFEFMILRA